MATAELSVAREKILEHRLVSNLAVLMLQQGLELDVLRSEFDANGYDVVLEAAGVMRHLQLKASVQGGARNTVSVNVRLRSRLSGCVVWLIYDPETLGITGYRWFGGRPGEPLPSLGTRFARHTRGNAQGEKAARIGHRLLARASFETLDGLPDLAERLFGRTRSVATSLVLSQLRERFGLLWRSAATDAVEPRPLAMRLADMIDGNRILEQLCVDDLAAWHQESLAQALDDECSDLGLLWTLLFIDERRTGFQNLPACSGPADPSRVRLANRIIELVRLEAAA